MRAENAVEWHAQLASRFEAKYADDPGFIERHAVWTRAIDRYVKPGDAALDLGCGTGIFSFHLANRGADVLGVDASAEMIAICQAKKPPRSLRFVTADVRDVRGRVTAIDVITCSSVLEYLPDLDDAFAMFAELLAPGGRLLMSLPNGASVYRRVEPLLHRVTGRPRYYKFVRHVMTAEAAAQRLGRHGFRVEHVEYYGGTPLLSPLLRHLGHREYADNLFLMVLSK